MTYDHVKWNLLLASAFFAARQMAVAQQPDLAQRMASSGLELTPVNPDFEEYVAQRKYSVKSPSRTTDEGYALGYIPPPFTLPSSASPREGRASLPAKFDLRTATPNGVTPVRHQHQCGSCWTFGAMASLESYLKSYHYPQLASTERCASSASTKSAAR